MTSKSAFDMTDPIEFIDSHTAGEPTRVVIGGGPNLGDGSLAQRLQRFRTEFDFFRTATVTEPRGSDVLVGALLCEPTEPDCLAGVIFFNNVGYLGMCGHGMIGVVETLRHCGRIESGCHRFETPVGIVTTEIEGEEVSIGNVESYRVASEVKIEIDSLGTIVGDVAWGGNWFFLVREPLQRLTLDRLPELMAMATTIREAVNAQGHPEVDHVELFGEAHHHEADARNFVLCPGLQYDRSPCGTGTSAKLACLAADGKLAPGERWTQEGILGTSFVGHYQWADSNQQKIRPVISGQAHVTSEGRLLFKANDPFRWGIGDHRS
jgi:4-hydroxyproline epimerase